MSECIEHRISNIRGNIRHINASSSYDLHKNALLPYWNKAESLRSGALVLWHTYNDDTTPINPTLLGFADGFSFGVSLPPIFYLLSGLSIEVLLKGICKAVEQPVNNIHRLVDLAKSVGIDVSDDDTIILRAMTEYIYWAGRYPTPTKPDDWDAAQHIFDSQRRYGGQLSEHYITQRCINLDNYNKIWARLADYFLRAENNTYESVTVA